MITNTDPTEGADWPGNCFIQVRTISLKCSNKTLDMMHYNYKHTHPQAEIEPLIQIS